MPALKTRKVLGRLPTGALLELRCTDPLATIDIPNLLNETGDRLMDTRREGEQIVFLIERAASRER